MGNIIRKDAVGRQDQIHAGCVEAFPCAYVQGEVIHSDKTWKAEDYSQPLVPVGVCKYFTKPGQNPTVWEYTEKECKPGTNLLR